MVTVEDLGGAVEVMFFTKTYLACAPLLAMDAVCSVKARVRRREDGVRCRLSIWSCRRSPRGRAGPWVLCPWTSPGPPRRG